MIRLLVASKQYSRPSISVLTVAFYLPLVLKAGPSVFRQYETASYVRPAYDEIFSEGMIMWEMAGTILILLIAIGFVILLAKDGAGGEARRDDRDARKSHEMISAPGTIEKTQQPAEVQVGEEDAATQPSRFEPDPKAEPELANQRGR
jgi:hypothetical protein